MSAGLKEKTGVSNEKRVRIEVTGRVQGVGFRPTVYQFATDLKLRGFVENSTDGVTIEVEGKEENILCFIKRLKNTPPPLSKVEKITVLEQEGLLHTEFQILESKNHGECHTEIPVDTTLCADCKKEMEDANNRRYKYPFTNCTNCGPRFTIIQDIPYDRPMTTMEEFTMCPKCQKEYNDPRDRRFHAQPISCPDCGPKLAMLSPSGKMKVTEPLESAIRMLQHGIIMAVKGLGGYHLVCDATNKLAVQSLRRRKNRPDKPLAIMFPNVDIVREYCHLHEMEEKLLTCPESPIVLLKKKKNGNLSPDLAPGNSHLGVMLPYTPLHQLLMQHFNALVMTSGNFTDEPIISEEMELQNLMEKVIDCALVHNRPIAHKCDDSIVRVINQQPVMLRRARGYVPNPVELLEDGPAIFAAGAQMKSTFCLSKGNKAYFSQHLGDLQEYPSTQNYEKELAELKKLLEIEPDIAAYDLHPDYWSTRFVMKSQIRTKIGVQHHHAHIASCMVEHGLTEPVIGISFDGTGYGTDGNLWGGEFLLCDLQDFQRVGHLAYQPLPGGEQAILEPWRTAVSYLYSVYGKDLLNLPSPVIQQVLPSQVEMMMQMMDKKVNSPLTSSVGRLFDAVYGILGFGQRITFEGQTGIFLESIADPNVKERYEYSIEKSEDSFQIITKSILQQIQEDLQKGISPNIISGKFHNTVIAFSTEMALLSREKYGNKKVVLSGGCFQNAVLTEGLIQSLESNKFEVYSHHQVPPNDGGIALGQLAVAMAKIQYEEKLCV